MSIESHADWTGLREVGRVTRLVLDALEAHARAGVTTGELDEIAATLVALNGAQSAPAIVYHFPRTVLISVNDEIVHGVPGARRLASGDLVKLDVTLEKNGYVADAARTVIVGRGSAVATRLARCAADAFDAALRVATAGARVNQIGHAVAREVRRQGFTVVHGLAGHGVGRTIHEWPNVPNHYVRWQQDVLTDGLVLTIEPIISAGSPHPVQSSDGWTIRTEDGSLSAHHEHTIVITRGAPIILTAA
jgi:methionyl aminopeptidase